MTDKYKLPMSSNPRRDVTTTEVGNDVSTPAKKESKHQGTIEKQNLERIKNIGEALKLFQGITDIAKIRESGRVQVGVIEAQTRKLEADARSYIEKINAETSQYIVKGQIATSLIQAISDMINQNPDLNDMVKLEAVKSLASLVNSTVRS